MVILQNGENPKIAEISYDAILNAMIGLSQLRQGPLTYTECHDKFEPAQKDNSPLLNAMISLTQIRQEPLTYTECHDQFEPGQTGTTHPYSFR